MKILIVEDDELLREMLARKLIEKSYIIETAEDGEIGLSAMRVFKPDLVLLDLIMPKKSGFQVLEEMQADELLRKIPVIIISNSGQPVELEKAKQLGVLDWIIKTEFNPSEVVEKVMTLEKQLFLK